MKCLRDLRNHPLLQWLQVLLFATLLVSLTACATGSQLVNHSFEFDARRDSPDVEILDYRYGNSKQPGARVRESDLISGMVRQYVGITGEMLRGDDLYVKWRGKSTGAIYEDTVDLRNRLPSDIKNHRIRFIIGGSQLYVYLISPEKLNPNPCPPREELRRLKASDAPLDKIFSMYCSLKITIIYPDQPTSLESK